MPFLTKLQTEHVKGKNWKVISALAYASHKTDNTIIVPRGFVTDYASIPRILLSVFGRPSGRMVEPSVLHDYLYRTKTKFTRKQSDKFFLEAMKDKDISWLRRRSMYIAVRARGWSSFNG